jgi:hypothetical protein
MRGKALITSVTLCLLASAAFAGRAAPKVGRLLRAQQASPASHAPSPSRTGVVRTSSARSARTAQPFTRPTPAALERSWEKLFIQKGRDGARYWSSPRAAQLAPGSLPPGSEAANVEARLGRLTARDAAVFHDERTGTIAIREAATGAWDVQLKIFDPSGRTMIARGSIAADGTTSWLHLTPFGMMRR